MDEASIIQYIVDAFEGVDVMKPETSGGPEIAFGDSFFIYDPDRNLEPQRKFPFATLVTKDYGDFDNASNLNRPGVFRLNIGVSRETYIALFGPHPAKDYNAAELGYDFAALDQLLPHPLYAPQSWVCILNPSDGTFQQKVQPLLAEAYDLAVRRYSSRERP